MAYRSPLYDIPSDLARTLRGALTLRGRATRTEAWTYLLIGFWIAALLAGVLTYFTGGVEEFSGQPSVAKSIVTLLYCIPLPALFARRLHDIGWAAWSALLVPATLIFAAFTRHAQPEFAGIEKQDFGWPGALIGLAGIVYMLVVALLPSGKRADQYGQNPRLVAD